MLFPTDVTRISSIRQAKHQRGCGQGPQASGPQSVQDHDGSKSRKPDSDSIGPLQNPVQTFWVAMGTPEPSQWLFSGCCLVGKLPSSK